MKAEEHDRLRRFEDRYWWHVARRETALAFADLHRPRASAPLRVLDAGCGTGALLDALRAKTFDAVGLDFAASALGHTRSRGHASLARGSLDHLPFADASFDLVFALDVLEHLDDDVAAARELRRSLRPGGALVATVPAYQALFGPHDQAVDHRRRYSARQLRGVLEGAGLEVVRCTYLMAALLPAFALQRGASRLLPRSAPPEAEIVEVGAWLNGALLRLQRAELRIALKRDLPFGSSLLAVARRT